MDKSSAARERTSRQFTRRLVCGFTAFSVAACATSPEQFARDPSSASDAEVCQAAADATGWADRSHRSAVYDEYARRQLSSSRCEEALAERSQKRAMAGIAILAGALLVAAAKRGGGGTAPATAQPVAQPSAPTMDYEWEWDQFYNHSGQPIWACRGVQTGQFAPEQRCLGKLKLDWKWPGLVFRP